MTTTNAKKKTSDLSIFARNDQVPRGWGAEVRGDVPIENATERARRKGEGMRPPPGSELPGARDVPKTEEDKRAASERKEIDRLKGEIAKERHAEKLAELKEKLAELKRRNAGKLASFARGADRKLLAKKSDDTEIDDTDDTDERPTGKRSDSRANVTNALAKQVAQMKGPTRIH